ncbi:MAG: hypothetical protein ACR2LA_00610, partial [Acidimicrobiales bacterium]
MTEVERSHGPDDPGPADDPAQAEGALAATRQAVEDGVAHLGTLLRGAGRAMFVVGVGITLVGIFALAVGLAAWHGSVLAVAVVVLVALPAIVGPRLLHRRVSALVEAVSHPAEVADEARDLLGRLRSGEELRQLADRLRGSHRTAGGGRVARGSRLLRALGTARSASAVLGLVEPDPRRHPRLVPLQPARVRSLWWWLLASAAGLVMAVVLSIVALIVLA